MRHRLAAVLIAASLAPLLAPGAALACAMPRHVDAKALARAMEDIDAAAAPAAPVEAARPAAVAPRAPAANAAAPAQAPVAPASVIPEVAPAS